MSLLLAILTACGAQAQQPEELQADQIEPAKPVQLSEAEKPEISLEDLVVIFEDVYTTASENYLQDWSIDFQITDEIGKINSAIPDDKKAPANLRTLYTEWRTERTAPEPEPEPVAEEAPAPVDLPTFDDCNETVYATSTVNVRSGPSTDDEKIGSLSTGDSVTRTGIGTGDYAKWSRVEFSNGTVAYVSSNYLSTTKPVAQQTSTSKPSGGGSTQTSTGGSNKQINSGSQSNTGGSSNDWRQNMITDTEGYIDASNVTPGDASLISGNIG